nr:hypothetical protein [uncultured Methanospirillum sp.]
MRLENAISSFVAVPITLPRYIAVIINEDPVPSSLCGAVSTTLLATGPPAHPQKTYTQ